MFATSPPPLEKTEDLENNPDFKGLNIPKGKNGKIDPMQDLFRTDWPGVTHGENKRLMQRDLVVPPDALIFSRSHRCWWCADSLF